MSYYADTADILMRLIPYKADNPLFSEDRIEEIIDAVEAEIDSALQLLGYGIPADGVRDIAMLKQVVIKAVVAEVLLQGYTELTDKQLQDARDSRDRYWSWLEALRDGDVVLVEGTTDSLSGHQLVITEIGLGIDEPESDLTDAEFD